AAVLPGRTIREVEIIHPGLIDGESPEDFTAGILGRRIRGISRRAKNIIADLGAGERLLVNLGMTGRLLIPRPGDPLPTHLGVRMGLDRGVELLYHDPRRFGRLWRASDEEWSAFDARLGVEPLAEEFTAEFLYDLTRRSRVAVKTWLMDQARVVGVGNIYVSEALFRAAIDPRRPANTLSREEAERARHAIREVLTEAIEFRGTTLLDYRDANGERGEFVSRLRVYDRGGEPCMACGAPVQRIVQSNRSTFFCENCQR
ncbi:MAG TPA: bifunctional DNA-formamidopyrimidine glycosylase/DNA-(apurinic or apyrimidinic site) lyase, partial [Longimicrobium sp.]|nr:bifunctional DNA-formamidopyrimidine glycosylase/DNA-(apurinic or apyrimidinic site) lyase [Longimicrobium sp.]